MLIKQLKLNGEIFAPQTISEAVLIHDGAIVVTLDKVINRKIDSITCEKTSGLTITRQGNDIDITHSNNIEPDTALLPLLISYDNHGHIVESKPFGKNIITVEGLQVMEFNGATDNKLNFGDDFKSELNAITLKWNNYGDT